MHHRGREKNKIRVLIALPSPSGCVPLPVAATVRGTGVLGTAPSTCSLKPTMGYSIPLFLAQDKHNPLGSLAHTFAKSPFIKISLSLPVWSA